MSVNRNARLAVVCILLTAITTCSRRHDNQDFLPSAPATQNALTITNVGEISLPADGVSTVRIEAQISPDANVTRTVRFHTTLGGWLETAAASAKLAGAGRAARPGGERQAELPQTVDKEADTAGRAAAFLQSTTTEGTAVVTVSVIVKDTAGNVTDTLASVTRDVSFVQVTDALELRVDPEQTFADGISAITLEAQISADSPAEWNMVTFETSLGTLDSLGADNEAEPQMTTVPTDSDRIARARLTSTTPGTASVKATIQEFPQATVSRFVTFSGLNPDSLTLSTSASEIPADGASQASVIATLDPSLPSREVTFTTSDGTFVSGTVSTDMKSTTATADVNNQATVQLKSGSTVNPVVQLTATVELSGGSSLSASATIAFVEVAASELSVTPDGLDFGQVTVDTTSDLGLTLGNHGDADLTISGLAIDPSGEGFSLQLPPSLPLVIPPAGSQSITIRYAPDAEESNSASLAVTSNDPVRPTVSVSLAGEGVAAAPNIAVDPTSLAFSGITAAGVVTENLVLEIRNTGTADLDVTDIVSSEGGGVFTPSTTAFTVAPGASVDVTVTFDPMAVVVYSETLTIESNDPDEPSLAIPVSGEGT